MSLVQHGTHTAMNKNKNISKYIIKLNPDPIAIIIWKSDAEVLKNTCPEWGNFVNGLIYAKAIPSIANEFTSQNSSINPIWAPRFGKSKRISPIYGISESLSVAINNDPI